MVNKERDRDPAGPLTVIQGVNIMTRESFTSIVEDTLKERLSGYLSLGDAEFHIIPLTDGRYRVETAWQSPKFFSVAVLVTEAQ